MSKLRKTQRQIQKNKGTFIYKKTVAKKMGCSVAELNEKLAQKEKKMKEIEGDN